MATTTYNGTSVPTKVVNMLWIAVIAVVAAVLLVFFTSTNRSAETGRPQAPPESIERGPIPEPVPGP